MTSALIKSPSAKQREIQSPKVQKKEIETDKEPRFFEASKDANSNPISDSSMGFILTDENNLPSVISPTKITTTPARSINSSPSKTKSTNTSPFHSNGQRIFAKRNACFNSNIDSKLKSSSLTEINTDLNPNAKIKIDIISERKELISVINEMEKLKYKDNIIHEENLSELKHLNAIIRDKDKAKEIAADIHEKSLLEIQQLSRLIQEMEMDKDKATILYDESKSEINQLLEKIKDKDLAKNIAAEKYSKALEEIKNLLTIIESTDQSKSNIEKLSSGTIEKNCREIKSLLTVIDEKNSEIQALNQSITHMKNSA
jgi:hypothetical protein